MAVEYELKYRANRQVFEDLQARLPGRYTVTEMTTTYYDTPNGDLAKLYWTLRHRQEGDIHICTLKTPAGLQGRSEYEWQAQRIEDAIGSLCRLCGSNALAELARNGLVEICGAKFTRTARMLRAGGTTVELAMDEGFLVGGGNTMPLAELEVELKDGSPEECRIIGHLLASAFGLEPEPQSKFQRARSLGAKSHGV